MELDDLKSVWRKDEASETPKISLEKQKEIHHPLEKIRQNMRMEFWSTVFIIPLVMIATSYFPVSYRFKLYIEVLLGSMAMVTLFFYGKFFKLYREINNPALDTYDALKDLLHQFDLNKQYYYSYYLSFVPFIVCEMIICMEAIPYIKYTSKAYVTFYILFTVSVGLFGLYLIAKIWFHQFYGKYIKRIEQLFQQIKE